MRDWTYVAAIAALTAIAAVRVASTHRVFSATLDEPVHLVAGYEWLHGSYRLDMTHPPLARALCALPLAALPKPASTHDLDAGNELLYHGNRYVKNLARARIGNLPFLIAAIVAVAVWARRSFSRGVAILAVAIFTSLPPLLGHAGLVTTDLAATATLTLALLALDLLLETSTLKRAAFLGLTIGLGVLAKFSFLVYFPVAALILIACRWRLPRIKPLLLAAAITLGIVWAGYHFRIAPPPELAIGVPLPAPELFTGFMKTDLHNRHGHFAYLLGEVSAGGWWYYFPVLFFYKSPLPFLMLLPWGIRGRAALPFVLIPLAIVLIAMTSSINIGVRHILPIYAPLSILAASGAAFIWSRAQDAFSRAALVAMLVWLFAGAARAHPDYLAWFNGAAGPNPSSIAVDSNLDWGQDVLRLERAVRELKIEQLPLSIVHSARLENHGIPAAHLWPHGIVHGWVAISETKVRWGEGTGDYAWLKMYRPLRQIGKSIRLYYIP